MPKDKLDPIERKILEGHDLDDADLQKLRDRVKEMEMSDTHVPVQALSLAYLKSPEPVRGVIDGECSDILTITLPMLRDVALNGPARPVAELVPIAESFAKAAANAPKEVEKALTATLVDACSVIAEAIDKAAKRVLLDDTECNRLASLELGVLHAKIVQTLTYLALTEEQKEFISERANADSKTKSD